MKRTEKRTRVKHSTKPEGFGYAISDTIERVTDGIKDYFYKAMEIKSHFAMTLHYKRLSSKNMKEFSEQFQRLYPGEIHTWKTDNGSENLGDFHQYLTKDGIHHVFSYPRCPKINAYIERYNRTVQEEFIDYHMNLLPDQELFNRKLAEYLIFYNTKRVHKGLGNMAPIQYLIDEGVLSQMCLTYTRC
jgi:transposase InsO family protein